MEEIRPVKVSRPELDFLEALRAEKGGSLQLNGDLSRFAQRFAKAIIHKDVVFPDEGRDMRARQFVLLKNYLEIVFICQKEETVAVAECALAKLKGKVEFRKFLDLELNSIGVALMLLKSGRVVVVLFAGLADPQEVASRVIKFVLDIAAEEFSVDALFDMVNQLRDRLRLPRLHKDVAMFKALNKICRKTNDTQAIEEECQSLTQGCGTWVVTRIEKGKHSDYFRSCFEKDEFVAIALSPALSAAMQLFWAQGFHLNVVVVTNELRAVETSLDVERRFAETPQPKRAQKARNTGDFVTPRSTKRRRIDATPQKLDFHDEKAKLRVSSAVTHADVSQPVIALALGEDVSVENYERDEIAAAPPASVTSPLVEDDDWCGTDVEVPRSMFVEAESLLDVRIRLLDLNRRFYSHYSVTGSVSERILSKVNKFRRNNDLKQLRHDLVASSQLRDLLTGFRNRRLTYMQLKDNIWKMNERYSTFCCRTFSSKKQRTAKDEFISDFIAVDTMKCFLLSRVNRIAFAEFTSLNEVQLVCLIYVA